MTPQDKASKLYTDAYTRWCYELSHEKNYLTAKDISLYICKEMLGNTLEDDLDGYKFWSEVKKLIEESNHNELYKNNL